MYYLGLCKSSDYCSTTRVVGTLLFGLQLDLVIPLTALPPYSQEPVEGETKGCIHAPVLATLFLRSSSLPPVPLSHDPPIHCEWIKPLSARPWLDRSYRSRREALISIYSAEFHWQSSPSVCSLNIIHNQSSQRSSLFTELVLVIIGEIKMSFILLDILAQFSNLGLTVSLSSLFLLHRAQDTPSSKKPISWKWRLNISGPFKERTLQVRPESLDFL